MATSPYFNHYSKSLSGEQLLLEDLLNECVHIMGADCYYIIRETGDSIDWILGEDPTSKFEKAYPMEMLITNVDQWSEGQDLFSKFGMKINKGTNVVVTRRVFNKYVPTALAERPREGDLVYIPVMQKLYEVKFVDKEDNFYTHGKVLPYYYELQLEMFKYSQENIETGYEEVDVVEPENTYAIDLQLSTGSGDFHKGEVVEQGDVYATVKSWDIANSILSVYSINGEFESGNTIVGVNSGSTWNIADYDDLNDAEDHRLYNNDDIQNEANNFILTTETNPFLTP